MIAEPASARSFLTGPEDEGLRLDAFLVQRCPDLSRSRIHGEFERNEVLVDGRSRPKSFRLKAGCTVVFDPQPLPEYEAVAQDIPLDVIFQDEHLLILNKPVGLVVHPAAGHPDGTLVNALLHHCRGLDAGGDPLRPGIVHRLDRDTSGLLAVALTEQAHRGLSEQLKDHTMGRTYLALSWGRWAESEGDLEGNIGRHPRHRQRMAVLAEGGRPALTHFQVLEDFGFVQYCRVVLQTGRTHQIRVHFAQRGHPVVGDPLYGDDRRVKGIHNLDRPQADWMVRRARRQLLHAAELRLVHPHSGQELEFQAPLPRDMTEILAHLRAEN